MIRVWWRVEILKGGQKEDGMHRKVYEKEKDLVGKMERE